MAKIKLTKNELKKQKDSLKRFKRYLPTLVLKKQQLQTVIRKVESDMHKVQKEQDSLIDEILKWVGLFSGDIKVEELFDIEDIKITRGNIAGVDIPVFEKITIKEKEYNLFTMPLWVDTALDKLVRVLSLGAERIVLEEQVKLLQEELRVTTQRVNLFEKVKIPEAESNIKKILVFLGDQQTAAVVRGKISKNKLDRAS
jgi:V/A-type H+/Na+-transporting ATPase subunit D